MKKQPVKNKNNARNVNVKSKSTKGAKNTKSKSRLKQFISKYKAVLTIFAFAVIGTIALGISSASSSKTQLQYFVAPHPDDVYSAWGMVQHSTSNYPVFIVATAGENTANCKGQTVTVTGYGTFKNMVVDSQSCKDARLASLNAWLDDQAKLDSTLDNLKKTTKKQVCFTPQSTSVPYNANNHKQYSCATYIIGPQSARVEFDLGDSNATVAEVNWAIKNVRSHRNLFPVTKEYGVVADGFYNKKYTGCAVYTNVDHAAVQTAIFGTDQFADDPRTAHPQFGVTCASDPDYKVHNYSKTVSASDYSANMSCPNGYFQKRFVWLTFSQGGCWSAGTQVQTQSKSDGVFPSNEYFWLRYHPHS